MKPTLDFVFHSDTEMGWYQNLLKFRILISIGEYTAQSIQNKKRFQLHTFVSNKNKFF